MELSIATIIGQVIVLAVIAAIICFVALIPMSLKRIAHELSEIRGELRKMSERGGSRFTGFSLSGACVGRSVPTGRVAVAAADWRGQSARIIGQPDPY